MDKNNFVYYGLFLTEDSKKLLLDILKDKDIPSKYTLVANDITKHDKIYLDHCTILHTTQKEYNSNILEFCKLFEYLRHFIVITHIGMNDTNLAFRVNTLNVPCANEIPHITICTMNRGNPVNSNSITEWTKIKPIIVETYLKYR